MRQLFIISLIMIGGCIPCFGLSIDEISGEWKTDFDRTWRDLMQNPQMKTKSAQEIAAAKEMVRQVVAALRVTISPTQLHVAEHGTAKAIRVVRFESLSASAGAFTVENETEPIAVSLDNGILSFTPGYTEGLVLKMMRMSSDANGSATRSAKP